MKLNNKLEEEFLLEVAYNVEEPKEWDIKLVKKMYSYFIRFIEENDFNELSLLRYGEVLLGNNIDTIDFTNLADVKNKIKNILNNMEDFNIPVLNLIIACILKITIERN